jgi:hypothetical protein
VAISRLASPFLTSLGLSTDEMKAFQIPTVALYGMGKRGVLEGSRLCYWAALFSEGITTSASGGLVMTGWFGFAGF